MRSKENILGNILLMTLTILVLLPMAAVLFQIVCPNLILENFNLKNLSQLLGVFEKPLWKNSFKNSLSLGLATTFFGISLATVLAYIRVKFIFPCRKALDLCAWIIMIVPSFLLAQGWVYFASGNGIAKEWLGISGLNEFIFSFPGLVFVMSLCKFPLAYLTVKNVLEWYPDSLIQAARMNGASPIRIWFTVQGPLCIPAFLSAAMLIFMDTIGDYGMSSTITAVFPFPTLPYSIFSAVRTSPARFDMAGVLSFYLISMIMIAMLIQNLAVGRRKFDFLGHDAVRVVPKKLSKLKEVILSVFVILFIIISLGISVGSNFIMSFSSSISIQRFSFTLDNYIDVLTTSNALLAGLQNSLIIAATSALIGIFIGFFVSYTLSYSRYKGKKIIDAITLIAMSVPGIIFGIGYIFVWNQRWLSNIGLNLYGKPSILILASVAVSIPLTNRVLVAGMAKIPADLMLAAQVQGAGMIHRIRTILLPLLHGSTVSAILVAFGGSVFNLAITTILYPPNFSTLPVYINTAYNNLDFGYSAAATILGATLIVTIMLMLEFILNRFNRKHKLKSDS